MRGYFHNVLRSDALTFSLSGPVRRKLPFHSFVINDHLDLDKGKGKKKKDVLSGAAETLCGV